MRTVQLFLASTLYGTATLAAALDSGAFPPADRRILLTSNNAATPETTPPLTDAPGFAALRTRFDDVLDWNEAIAPLHPSGWTPRPDDVPLWERQLRAEWGLEGCDVSLVLESIQVAPAQAVAQLFPDAPIEVYADGLMSYGPTRNKLDPLVGGRVRRLLHLDLVPGLRPLLLGEFGVPGEVVPTDAFLKVLTELPYEEADLSEQEPPALLLGQYLSALDILTPDEEEALHVRMLRGAVARGHRRVVFKPHPSAPARWSRRLESEAETLGAHLTVFDSPLLAEVLFRRLRPALVVGCFSTALLTAHTFYGIPVARVGTDTLLERLTPYENSNRIPVTLADALLPDLEATTARTPPPLGELSALLAAVGFAMQPQVLSAQRTRAEGYLLSHLSAHTRRYFKRRRLTALALPGAVPQQLAFLPRNEAVRRMARRARRVQRRFRTTGG
ncbi:alpha-2,8-polysialyltransferase family protein [Streptomyces sp. NBC_00237]|uniref:alpha-2,8-polysialyltransferase family protein n=1 Tax=Streptomyces sp. NBC_00237 TaxID=2975687 RepID=UPI00225815F7|nr:alpha-2,8-polysialyltransferase family protein [Streptomyces sp. NBC_00237]MCX5204652.1 alpha-2,8-polysialyltransferase family protein [Streptomyces sp. NBC_00237]